MRVAMIARDMAPSSAFKYVSGELIKHGVEVLCYLGYGKPFVFNAEELTHTDVVLLGMSSSGELAEPEICTAKILRSINKPYGFYADTYGCHKRPCFGPGRDGASFLHVINDAEARRATDGVP